MLGHISVVCDDGTPVPLPSVPQRRLVAFLASRANTVTSIGAVGLHLGLTDGAVRTGVARVRRRLGPGSALVTEGPGYMLLTDRIDHLQFEAAVHSAQAQSATGTDQRALLERALAMWRGDAYAEFAHEEWAATEAARLEEMRASATEALVDLLLVQGEHEEALEHAWRVIERHPYRDRPRGQRMRALASTGRTTEALRSFQEYRALLLDEVGTVPSPPLVELEQRISVGGLPLGDVRFSTDRVFPAPTDPRDVRLPRNQGFGLDEIVEQIAAALAHHQLVTLTGVGGNGKTRSALTAAARLAPDFDRVVTIDLRPASSPETVLAAAARALGLEAAGTVSIVEQLTRRSTLVVVDNCEHVLEPSAALVGAIVAGAASSRVLATSRLPLAVTGECVHVVRPMADSDAAALFADRSAQWRDSSAADGAADRRRIEEICARLDGIPLAVELAAACVAHMTLSEIAAQLDDRLTFFPGDPTRSQQQRTLRATMDWSYGLLDRDAQSLLRAVTVFSDGFDAAAAAAVWGHTLARTLAGLGALVRASLVLARPRGDSMRYELLETVRLHAAERADDAGETVQLRSAHGDHYAGRLEAIEAAVLLRPTHESHPDISNHDRMLEWVEGSGDLRRVGQLAWRTAMANRADCWTDPGGRYLGRDDVATVLTGHERSCYLAASFENANVLGRWTDQLRFAELGLETATGPVRIVLLRGAANACTMLAPERVDSLIDEAIALADPGDLDLQHDLLRTRIDGRLLAGQIEAAAAQLRDLWAEVLSTGVQHATRPLAGIDLLWLTMILGPAGEVTTLGDTVGVLPGGAVAGHCASAIASARAGRTAESANELVLAFDTARGERVPLVDNDVAVVAALRALELEQPDRACRLLAALPGGPRSAGSHQLYQHVRDRVRRALESDVVGRLRSEALSAGPPAVIADELRRLRAEATEAMPATDLSGDAEA